MIFLNEVYFGKDKNLIEIENKLDEFRNKYIGKQNSSIVKCNSDPLLHEVNRQFEKYFGFGCFALTIPLSDSYNAYTVPISYMYDVKNKDVYKKPLLVDNKRYKFNSKYKFTCTVVVYSKLMFDSRFTTEEIMSIILHEIGHNFYFCLYDKNTSPGVLSKLYTSIKLTKDNIKCVNNNEEPNANVNNNSSINDAYKLLSYYANKINDNIYNAFDYITISIIPALTSIMLYPLVAIPNEKDRNILYTRYNDEKTADNFASIYGYGSSLITGLRKMDAYNENKVKVKNVIIPIFGPLTHLNRLIPAVLYSPFDEHPDTLIRAQNQLDLLKAELKKKDLDPVFKKSLLKDIKVCEDALNDVSKDIEKSHKSPFFGPLYKKLLAKEFDLKSEQDKKFSDKERFKKIDKTYDKLKK